MSTLKVNELDTKSGTVITVAAGKTLDATLADDAIGAAQIATNAVTADAIAADAVDSSEIAAGAVTNAKTDFQPGTIFKGDGSSADGKITLNCSQNTHGVSIQSPAHSAGASYTLTLPTTDGNADEFMQTDGAGALTFAAVSGGLSVASQWNMTTDFTGSVNPIINWSESGTTTSGNYPTTSGITESAGTFTLASTGYWLIMFQGYSSASANDDNMYHINTSTGAGTGWGERSKGGCFTYSGNDAQVQIVLLLKCTSTADNQVRFGVTVVSAANDTIGSSTQFKTGATFLKVADL